MKVYIVYTGDEIDEIFETRTDAEAYARANTKAIRDGHTDEDAALEAIEEHDVHEAGTA